MKKQFIIKGIYFSKIYNTNIKIKVTTNYNSIPFIDMISVFHLKISNKNNTD